MSEQVTEESLAPLRSYEEIVAQPGPGVAPGAPPLTYTEIATQGGTESFIIRVQSALLQDANANRIQATTPAATDVTMTAQRDRLGRRIVDDPHFWAVKFARLVAVILIGKATLLDPAVTTDPDIFSAVSTGYDRFLSSL